MCAQAQGPTLSFSPDSVALDTYEGFGQARLKVQLSSAPQIPVSVSYTVQPGLATANSDFQLSAGQIQFAAGETSKVRADGCSLRVRACMHRAYALAGTKAYTHNRFLNKDCVNRASPSAIIVEVHRVGADRLVGAVNGTWCFRASDPVWQQRSEAH